MVFSELFETLVSHVLVFKQVYKWIPACSIQIDQLSMYTAALMLRNISDMQCCVTYWSHSFLTVVIAPSFHSFVFFFVLVSGTACVAAMYHTNTTASSLSFR